MFKKFLKVLEVVLILVGVYFLIKGVNCFYNGEKIDAIYYMLFGIFLNLSTRWLYKIIQKMEFNFVL